MNIPRSFAGWRQPTAAERAEVRIEAEEAFKLLHGCHRRLREELAYNGFLESEPKRSAVLVAQVESGWNREDERISRWETNRLELLRTHRRGVSPLVLAFCAHDGLHPSTVLDAILPRGLKLMPGDGHPWIPTDSEEFQEAVATQQRFETNSSDLTAYIRRSDSQRGVARVRDAGGIVGLHAKIGRGLISTHWEKGTIELPDDYPDTLLEASVGRRLEELIDHPVVRGNYRITGIDEIQSDHPGRVISFDCPSILVPTSWVSDEKDYPTRYTDPRLNGSDAVADMVMRTILAIRTTCACPSPTVLLREARTRVRRINAAQPRREPLPAPTSRQVEIAIALSR